MNYGIWRAFSPRKWSAVTSATLRGNKSATIFAVVTLRLMAERSKRGRPYTYIPPRKQLSPDPGPGGYVTKSGEPYTEADLRLIKDYAARNAQPLSEKGHTLEPAFKAARDRWSPLDTLLTQYGASCWGQGSVTEKSRTWCAACGLCRDQEASVMCRDLQARGQRCCARLNAPRHDQDMCQDGRHVQGSLPHWFLAWTGST